MKKILKWKYLPIVKISCSAALLILARFLPISDTAKLGVYIASLIVIGIQPFIESLKIFKTRSLDENFLMLLAAVGAFVLGEYAEGILVLLLSAVGEWFEHYAVNKSRTFISRLLEMRAPYANLLCDGEETKVDPEDVKVGDILLIKPGERVPLDGVVIGGATTLDTSALTGESLPRNVEENDEIISGCINLTSAITVKVTKIYEESAVAKILDLVENSTEKKAKTENFITKFARFYTPIVVALAVIIAVIPPLIDNMQWSKWVYKALSFLVISCPCALVISVPLSFFRGIGLASKRGILIKGSSYMEKLAKVKTVVCDKTGTLTCGNFALSEILPADGIAEEELLSFARTVEGESNHPIAKSIVGGEEFTRADEYSEIAGKGVRAVLNGKTYYGGNEKLMAENGVDYIPYSGVGSAVYFSEGERYLGCIVIKDEIKEDAFALKEKLSACGADRLVMLSGDNENVCAEVAEKLGIKEYCGRLLPQDKLAELARLKTETGAPVAFLGDGINDAPCLAEADVGIAMGGLGSDVAIETADAVIMEDKPSKAAEAIKISRRTIRISKENITFALGIKLAVMVLTVLGISNILLAIFADVGVSILAILNAVRPMRTAD